jgi:formate dehydrogenase iron-sulfur subunit
MIKIYVPRDSSALAVDADDVAKAIAAEAAAKKISIQIIRNSSRGLAWLETFVEVETAQGRVGYGPVEVGDVKRLFAAKFYEGEKHQLCHGLVEEMPYLKNQERLTFARARITDPVSI